MPVSIRHAEPRDHVDVIAVVDDWWGGRSMAAMLPKLFFVHFRDTSFVAEEDGRVVGFLCGFRSQTYEDEAYRRRPERINYFAWTMAILLLTGAIEALVVLSEPGATRFRKGAYRGRETQPWSTNAPRAPVLRRSNRETRLL